MQVEAGLRFSMTVKSQIRTSLRHPAVIIALLAALFIIYRFRTGKLRPGDEAGIAISDTNTVANPTSDSDSNNLPIATTAVAIASRTVEEQIRSIADAKNVPIQFWGRVADQEGNPLSGVAVKARIREWSSSAAVITEAGFRHKEATTGNDGRFEMNGGRGDVLTIEALEKEGYEAEPGAKRSLGYNTADSFIPDPQSPVEFRMWRLDAAKQQLVTGDKFFTIIPDGRIYTIDLLQGTSVEGEQGIGDLRLWIKRDAHAAKGKRFDWSFEVIPINGGIVQETDHYASMFIAPMEGYTAGFKREMVSSQKGWSTAVGSQKFYVTTRAGQLYGRIDIEGNRPV